jgi:hypothetical protein
MKDPAVLFYTKDFLTGTAFFTDAERGQYIRLLCEQHQNGHIPENHMVSISFSLGSPVCAKFTKDKDGNYFNERMELEIEKRAKFTDSRAVNGKLGGRPKTDKKPSGYASGYASAEPNGKPTNNLVGNGNNSVIKSINSNINELLIFDEFRSIYPGTKRGNKTEFENFIKRHKNWKEVLPILKSELLRQIDERRKLKSENKFVPEWKMLTTWINGSYWEEAFISQEVSIRKEIKYHLPSQDE